MTATLVVNADMGNYSHFLGSSELLSNGNLAFTSGGLGPAERSGRAVDRGAPEWHQGLCAADEANMSIAPTSRAPSTAPTSSTSRSSTTVTRRERPPTPG